MLFDADSPADFLYLIERGQVRLFQAGPESTTRLISILGAGDWCGLSGLGDARAYGLRATAESEATVWRVPIESVRRKLATLPPIASELITQLARKLREAHESAGRLVFDDCSSRLLKTLIRFAETSAASPGESGDVELRITHQQLAQAVGRGAKPSVSPSRNSDSASCSSPGAIDFGSIRKRCGRWRIVSPRQVGKPRPIHRSPRQTRRAREAKHRFPWILRLAHNGTSWHTF